MLKELVEIIDVPYKRAKTYVDITLENEKRASVMAYAKDKAEVLGELGQKIIESPAFFNKKWFLLHSRKNGEVFGLISYLN